MKHDCKCYCNELTCFWKEGNYSNKLFSVEGLEIASGTTKIEYLYKCCKITGVKLTGTITYGDKTYTTTIIYCCDGKYTFTDSLGSKICGKWNKKCCNLCTLVSGIDKLLGNEKVKGKIVDKKDGYNYSSDVYRLENCKCVLKYRYVLTKL